MDFYPGEMERRRVVILENCTTIAKSHQMKNYRCEEEGQAKETLNFSGAKATKVPRFTATDCIEKLAAIIFSFISILLRRSIESVHSERHLVNPYNFVESSFLIRFADTIQPPSHDILNERSPEANTLKTLFMVLAFSAK